MHKGIWTIKGCNFIFQGLLKTGRHKASATWASHGIWNCRPKNQSFKLQYRLQTSRGWAHMPHPSQCHELSGKVEIRCRNDHFYDWDADLAGCSSRGLHELTGGQGSRSPKAKHSHLGAFGLVVPSACDLPDPDHLMNHFLWHFNPYSNSDSS